MTYANADTLVTTDWLADRLDDPAIRIVDGTSFLPGMGGVFAAISRARSINPMRL